MNYEHKQQLLADQRKSNEVEGVFGTGKRRYSLNLIMGKPKAGAEGITSRSFMVTCTEKIQ
jgi:IS5 family transposase